MRLIEVLLRYIQNVYILTGSHCGSSPYCLGKFCMLHQGCRQVGAWGGFRDPPPPRTF